MKINGKKLAPPKPTVIVIPRQEGDVVFHCQAVLDFTEFDSLCKRPMPPTIQKPGKDPIPHLEDPDYKKAVAEFASNRINWIVLQSLLATEGLELETVQKADPSTWGNWAQELIEAGFSGMQINQIVSTVFDACGMSQEKIDEATKRFLAGPGELQGK